MSPRRLAALALLALALVAFAWAAWAADASAPENSVPALAADPARLERVLRACEADPGGQGRTALCRNAAAARLAYTANRLRGGRGYQRPTPQPPILNARRERRA